MMIREATHDDLAAIARVHVDTWRTTYQGIIPDTLLANLSYKQREESWHRILDRILDSTEDSTEDSAESDRSSIFVAEDKSGRIVGFAHGGVERTDNPVYKGELNAIYILESYQQQGIGRKLIRAVVRDLSKTGISSMLVWVLLNNPACRFYEKLGGQKVYEKEIERGDVKLIEIAYGWMNTENLQHDRGV